MRSLCKSIAVIAVVGSIGLVSAATFRDFPASAERSASDSAEDSAYETTGSVGAMSTNRGSLSLTDEQRERIYRGVMRFPDAVHRDARVPELADQLSGDEPLQDLPASVTGE